MITAEELDSECESADLAQTVFALCQLDSSVLAAMLQTLQHKRRIID